MTECKGTVLVVEDDETVSGLEKLYLENDGYNVVTAGDGVQAWELLCGEHRIDVILSDVIMPNMDGYTLCQRVKNDDRTKDIPFIFVSALSDLDEKIKGYSAGGDEYVTKGHIPGEMLVKVNALFNNRRQTEALQARVQESFQAAMQAMTYSADLGQILEFHNEAALAKNYDDLAAALLKIASTLGLRVTLQIRAPSETLHYSTSGKVPPLEANVIELAVEKGRFFDFGQRTIVNHEDFSLLVKNMPARGSERYGMLKDTLGSLCNAFEAKLKYLIAESVAVKKTAILLTVKNALLDFQVLFGQLQEENLAAVKQLQDDLDDALMRLGLMEYQEEGIQRIAQKCYDSIEETFTKGDRLAKHFRQVETQLAAILE